MPATPLPVEVIAHRGASAYAGEHTFDAFDLALAQGTHRLELDVRVTADGEPVVLHDPTLRRTTGDPRAIESLTLAEVERLDPRTRPPTLEAVLSRYGAATRWLVELKRPRPGWEMLAVAAIRRHGLRERAVVQSFDGNALRRIHAAAPEIALAPLWRRTPCGAGRWEATARWASALSIRGRSLDGAAVAAARSAGLPLWAWTVDEPAEIERLVRAGVDGVITNVPDVAAATAARVAVRAAPGARAAAAA